MVPVTAELLALKSLNFDGCWISICMVVDTKTLSSVLRVKHVREFLYDSVGQVKFVLAFIIPEMHSFFCLLCYWDQNMSDFGRCYCPCWPCIILYRFTGTVTQ